MKKLLCLLAAFVLAAAPTHASNTTTSYNKEILDIVEKSAICTNGSKGDITPLRQKKYLFIYFSASWCPPCQKFTPKLVDFYKKNQSNGDFDVLFVSSDKDQKAMNAYMKKAEMPWLGVKLKSKAATAISEKYASRGIPHLVLIDGSTGEIVERGQANVMKKYEALKKAGDKK